MIATRGNALPDVRLSTRSQDMKSRIIPLALSLPIAVPVVAQAPPIDLEWSALRAYDENGDSRISRDAVYGDYVWSVYDPEFGVDDEHIYHTSN